MVEDGVTEMDDILKSRIDALKLERNKATISLDRLKAASSVNIAIDPEAVERFGRVMQENITSGEAPFRKAYIRSMADRIEVDDNIIRIVGSKSTLAQSIAGREMAHSGVRTCEAKWCTSLNKSANTYVIEIVM